jgi:hypothetical protein
VQAKGRGAPENTRGDAYENLVNHLMTALPLGHNNQPWRDKTHEELAIAIMHSLWCGWLSEAKANRPEYAEYAAYVVSFKNAINRAFEIGQEYAPERP